MNNKIEYPGGCNNVEEFVLYHCRIQACFHQRSLIKMERMDHRHMKNLHLGLKHLKRMTYLVTGISHFFSMLGFLFWYGVPSGYCLIFGSGTSYVGLFQTSYCTGCLGAFCLVSFHAPWVTPTTLSLIVKRYVGNKAATSTKILKYSHCWQLLEYEFSYSNARPPFFFFFFLADFSFLSTWHCAGRPKLTRARKSNGRLQWVKMFPSSIIHGVSVSTHHSETRNQTSCQCPDFCLNLEDNLSVIFSFKNNTVTIICDKFTSTNRRLQLWLALK